MDCNDLRKSSRNKRKRFSEDNTDICGIYAEGWEEETEEIELWLDCSLCGGWFHTKCVGFQNLKQEQITDLNYVCNSCN